VGARPGDYAPAELLPEIDAINARIYDTVNNGVYKAGFATRQEAYEEAVTQLFATLDELEAKLSRQRYLVGERITEADWRLFTTLVRFDAVYYGHFKCNLRRLVDYPALWAYTRELYQWPGIADTVDFGHIKGHYYRSHPTINPTRIVPLGPVLDFDEPHGREALAAGPPARRHGRPRGPFLGRRPSIHERRGNAKMKTSTFPLRTLALGLSTASLLALAAPAQAEPASFQIDPMHTFVYFEVVHFGTSTVRGRFN